MSSDTLLKALPGSPPWLVVLILFAFAVVLVERILRLSNDFASRRSDNQLLEQADKAASILEKLPDGHRSRSDLLTYISHGPIAELSERHTNRVVRKKTATKRQNRIWYMVASFGTLGIVFFPYLPAYYNEMLSNRGPDLDGIPLSLRVLLVTVPFFLYYGLLSMIVYSIAASMNYLAELGATSLRKLQRHHVRRRQERIGIGGVYEI